MLAFRTVVFLLLSAQYLTAQPYDFSAIDHLLQDSLVTAFDGNVTVLIKQNEQLVYRFQAGNINEDTRRAIASATKWISGAVTLSLAEQGYFALEDSVGKYLPIFTENGKGHFTIRQAFSISSGLFSNQQYETKIGITLEESVNLIAQNVPLVFAPGSMLAYEGAGMQTVGRIAEIVTGKDWQTVAEEQILNKCGMTKTTYNVFGKNPAIAGGIRSHANDYMKFLKMVANNGVYAGQTVLNQQSIAEMFINQTGSLPIYYTFWPEDHPDYAYGVSTLRYAFGAWVFAENPITNVVEEISSPGAFGTFPWIDRKRNLTGITFTRIAAGSQKDLNTQFKMMRMLRAIIDSSVTSVAQEAGTQTRSFHLEQNYPNPFNPSTTIQFSLAEKQNVRLAIFDLMGREVALLFDEEKAAGQHAVIFDASGLAGGVYFYQMRRGAAIETRKFLLLR